MSKDEIDVLRELGKKYAEIAALSIQDKRKKLWSKLNDLEKVKPLIWINEVCWIEMDVNDELKLRTKNEVAQRLETYLRRTIYQWEHMQGDMVVEPVIYSPYIIQHSGVGIGIIADFADAKDENKIKSRCFHNQFECEADIEKIKVPQIKCDEKRTEEFYQAYKSIFEGIVDVQKKGSAGFWFSPWDDIVFWMGADQVLLNLATEPEMMLKLINRLVDVYCMVLDQYEGQNLLGLNNCNWRVGSGAYGYTSQLPQKDFKEGNVRALDLWGCAAPQIFGFVSPAMHEEFSINVEKKWLKRFGMTYYGCCEAVSDRLDILNKIPNLRKISISPWANTAQAAEGMKGKYVMSLKPSPSIFASPVWDPVAARNELETKVNYAVNKLTGF